MAQLDGKIAFVTGAGSGLGREITLTFARAGARVAVADLRPVAAAAVDAELRALGAALACGPPAGDVADAAAVRGCFERLAAATGGIVAFTRALAREVGGQGILVNAIAPGYIDTPLLDVLGEQRATQTALIALQTVLGRLGEAREVAETALFLAGPGATYFTGQVLSPNGGLVV